MPWELYLIEHRPLVVCFQVVLEFVIFLVAALLWLLWCTQHINTNNGAEAKSLAFALPGYLLGWTCLMMTRLFGSRLKDKFCFSFYLASGVRFTCSAAILFPEFSREWYSVAYGLISLLCFVNTIFHIVTHPNPERRPVRRLIGPDGTISDDPQMEMMTVKQLENYKDIIRNYMDHHKPAPEAPAVRSVEVIKVSLRGSTDGTSLSESMPSGTSLSPGSARRQLGGTPRITAREIDKDTPTQPTMTSRDLRSPERKTSLGVIPGTTRRYSNIRVSQITIQSKSSTSPEPENKRSESPRRGQSPTPELTPFEGSLNDSRKSQQQHKPRIKFRSKIISQIASDHAAVTGWAQNQFKATPLESNKLQKSPRNSTNRQESHAAQTAPAETGESAEKALSRFSEDQIFDTLRPERQPAVPALVAQEHHPAGATPLASHQLRKCPHRSRNMQDVSTSAEPLARDVSRFSEDQIFDTVGPETKSHAAHHRPNTTTPRILRLLCPRHQQQNSRPLTDKGAQI